MNLVVDCPDCQAKVTIPDALMGRQVKCTKCQAIFIVEVEGESPSAPAAPTAPAPAPIAEPALREEAPRRRRRRSRRDHDRWDDDRARRRAPRDDYEEPEDTYAPQELGYDHRYVAPHRGQTIMTLGIFSIIMCCMPLIGLGLGAAAISMGRNELYGIDSGRIDPFGRGQTQNGQICGFIGCALSLLMMVFYIVMLLKK